MPFLRTQLGTTFGEPSPAGKLLASIDTANPNYCGKYHRVRSWLIEFGEDGLPWREIGLGEGDTVVLAGPSKDDYGFWLDTNMRFSDFKGETVDEEYFEKVWAASGVVAP
jgi:hypothetical protein